MFSAQGYQIEKCDVRFNFNEEVGDFRLPRIVDHEHDLQTTVIAGTMDYSLSPECISSITTWKASKEYDVYRRNIKTWNPRLAQTSTPKH